MSVFLLKPMKTHMPKKSQLENPVTPPNWNCGCGRSLHLPHCDGSHGRNEKQYAEWKRQCELESSTNSKNK
jgi:CDGSH-type Zn-finger protein